ncbi:MAG: hypothetical protein NT009_15220 [Proteobacteria bacterium]|nr:hypothetical protein [Pseudomonadota bacterium]
MNSKRKGRIGILASSLILGGIWTGWVWAQTEVGPEAVSPAPDSGAVIEPASPGPDFPPLAEPGPPAVSSPEAPAPGEDLNAPPAPAPSEAPAPAAATPLPQVPWGRGVVLGVVTHVTPAQHKILAGEDLHLIAAYYYGNARLWRLIYEANRKVLPNPNKLPEGITILVPAPPI